MRIGNLAAALLFGPLVACGDGGGGGSVTAPSPTPTSISISPATDLLKIKAVENFTATAISSSGSNAVTASWRSDNPSVVTIDSAGRATAVASGTATVIADYQGLSASRLLRVVPDYHGNWRGNARLLACEDDGDWDGICDDMGIGELDTIAILVTQQNTGVSGTLDVGGMAGAVTGTIAMDGTLTLSGTFTVPVEGVLFDISVVEWQTMSSDNARMNGRLALTMKTQLLTGQVRLQAELVNVNKSATLGATRPAAPGAVSRMISRAAKRRS
ncbi:MAG: Ig-like domain-containing protein [Acidobacteriota bacterium]